MQKWCLDYLRGMANIIIFLWLVFSTFVIPMFTVMAFVKEIIGSIEIVMLFLWFLYLPFIGIGMSKINNSKFLNNKIN